MNKAYNNFSLRYCYPVALVGFDKRSAEDLATVDPAILKIAAALLEIDTESRLNLPPPERSGSAGYPAQYPCSSFSFRPSGTFENPDDHALVPIDIF